MTIPIPCTYLLRTFHLLGYWLSAYANYCCFLVFLPCLCSPDSEGKYTSNIDCVNHKMLPDTALPSFCHHTVRAVYK